MDEPGIMDQLGLLFLYALLLPKRMLLVLLMLLLLRIENVHALTGRKRIVFDDGNLEAGAKLAAIEVRETGDAATGSGHARVGT